MLRRKEWVAMLLAGGQGSRLGVLTRDTAKPALPFGGKYRIIDFTLSNCVNSGIDTVGVLTQYQPLELNEYIGNGSAWDLDRMYGGVHILPPYQQIEGGKWYKGTANAVYQNLTFIERYDPQYVIVLSGDHIYSMDYGKMLIEHRKNKADCTIAVLNVEAGQASRFGIMNTDDKNRITAFEEKPRHPKSTLASMGVYIFDCEKLKKYLRADERKENSDNDFGKNIIPAMLKSGEKLYAYRFEGYWKDVGTLTSLWEANMDMISGKLDSVINTSHGIKVYSQSPVLPPLYISSEANVKNSIISDGCRIYAQVENSAVFSSSVVSKNSVVYESVIMPDCVIGEGCKIYKSIVGSGCKIGNGAVIGEKISDAPLTVLGNKIRIADGVTVSRGETVSRSRRF